MVMVYMLFCTLPSFGRLFFMLKNNSLLQFFFGCRGLLGYGVVGMLSCSQEGTSSSPGVFSLNALVLDELGDEQQELFKVNLLVVVEVKLLHVVGNGLGVGLLAYHLEQ